MISCANSHNVIGMHPAVSGVTMCPHALISHSTGITKQIMAATLLVSAIWE